MPNHMQKTLQDYLSKIKKPTTQIQSSSKTAIASSANWILRGCKHPRTPSLTFDSNSNDDAATLSDVDRFLFENFKSLYQTEYDEYIISKNKGNESNNKEKEEGERSELFFKSPRRFKNPPADISGSLQFLVGGGSLGLKSMTTTSSEDMASMSAATTATYEIESTRESCDDKDDFITVFAYSPSPCDDFKRSMKEMINARVHRNERVDWEFMEELLFCYLNLNDKKSYKYILNAFVDLVVLLRENSGGFSECSIRPQ